MLLTTVWPLTPAYAQDGLPIDYQMPTRSHNAEEMAPHSIVGWTGISSGAADLYWEPSTSNEPMPNQYGGEYKEFLHDVVPDQSVTMPWQSEHWSSDHFAATLLGASLIFGGLFYLATRVVKNMTLEIIMKAQVPGEGFSLAVAKYLHAMEPRDFEKAEREAYLKQQDALVEARDVTNAVEALRTARLTKFLRAAEVKIANTYFSAPLHALSLIETGLTLAELAKCGGLSIEQKALIKPVVESLILSVRKAATERRAAAYQPISVTLPLVKKPKMDELEAADALEEFAAELAVF